MLLLTSLVSGCAKQDAISTYETLDCTFHSYDAAGFELDIRVKTDYLDGYVQTQNYYMDTEIDESVSLDIYLIPIKQKMEFNNTLAGVKHTLDSDADSFEEQLSINYGQYKGENGVVDFAYPNTNLDALDYTMEELRNRADELGYQCEYTIKEEGN